LEPSDLTQYAKDLKLDGKRFEQCIKGETAGIVKADEAVARRLGVSGTPSFFIGTVQLNGTIALAKRINGAVSLEELSREVAALSEK
jgi:protein-disulfide isomerase